ncbi:hypothetical protein BJX61DRAFT_379119 [Aspergillus egyptiacus]|nr:hypothetical protein BJX61DRAFT_379119 [Aspergillus egyptiacus]
MSFFSDLAKEFKELKASLSGDGIKDKQQQAAAEAPAETNRAPPPAYDPGSAPHEPPQYPPQSLSSSPPPVPPGWVAQFDHASQRWYYIEQATGISRWEPPPSPAPYGQGPPPQMPHYTGPYPGQPDAQYSGYIPGMAPPGSDFPHGSNGADKQKDDKSKMLLAGAGGLAVGAVGGALVANALADDSDSEPQTATAPPPAELPPDETADGDSVSSSDREDVLEARQEYEQAQLAAQDSDASSSEEEELEKAREEYEETYEEVYDD